MTPTDKVLGQLAAIQTLTENFPISIFDKMQGKTYTSIFEYLIDVLNACGVNTNEIINYLLSEIYGIEADIEGGIEGFYSQIKNGDININEQNEFMQSLEMGIKNVFMGLLSSIFTCSAIPVLPNKVFDAPNKDSFKGKENTPAFIILNSEKGFQKIIVPTSIIDPMGLLDICPTSEDGKLFYATQGKDIYYKREYIPTTEIIEEEITTTENKTVVVTKYDEKRIFDKNFSVSLVCKDNSGFDDYSAENIYKFELSDSVTTDIIITVNYSPYNSKSSLIWEGKIPRGQMETEEHWFILPQDALGQRTIINNISINNNGSGVDIGNKTWVYLSNEGWSDWNNNGLDSISWGEENTATEIIETKEEVEVTEETPVTTQKEITVYRWEYVECSRDEILEEQLERVNFLPEKTDESSPEFIVLYEGLDPNMLYKSMDMNAFMWYALHKGMKNPQVEYNHMMWDSRVSAAKEGNGRKSASEWNEWYNSKDSKNGEFKYHGSAVTDKSPIYPIIQLEPQGMAANEFAIHIPAQTYWMPKIREANLKQSDDAPEKAFNASIYKFNWDYLTNIQILQPKLLLVGLCESLLGFSLSTISSTNISITKKIIETKLSSAIKSVIEANDMEVEDCYTSFSNDEVNVMLEEMLLSRYNASVYGGETSTVRVHDTQKYIDMLDKINSNISKEGNITQITKLVSEIISDPGTENTINYGIQLNVDNNLLKKLLWAITMPILLSIFTPQVLLLLYINFELMGITRIDSSIFFILHLFYRLSILQKRL